MIWKIWKKGKLKSQFTFLLYFPNHFTIQLIFLQYCSYLFTIQLTFLNWIVKTRKLWKKSKLNNKKIWKLWKKCKLNSEKIWKISTYLSSRFSFSFHYSTYISSVFSKSFHYSSFFSSFLTPPSLTEGYTPPPPLTEGYPPSPSPPPTSSLYICIFIVFQNWEESSWNNFCFARDYASRSVTSLMVLELTVKNRPSPRHLFLVLTLTPLELTELRSGPGEGLFLTVNSNTINEVTERFDSTIDR
jgi:hypothetical protein